MLKITQYLDNIKNFKIQFIIWCDRRVVNHFKVDKMKLFSDVVDWIPLKNNLKYNFMEKESNILFFRDAIGRYET